AHLAGAEGEEARYLAAAVELIHAATLLHDDVVDDSALRRGFKTANIVFGNKESVLVGDFLFARAFELMVKTGQLPVLQTLSRASCTISEGEVLQLQTQANIETVRATHLEVIKAKTAKLFEAAAASGAAAKGPSPHSEALARYGMAFGIAYQLVDDALDYGPDALPIGKSIGDDFRERKMTMPVILAYERARTEDERQFWRTAFDADAAPQDFDRARELMLRDGALDAALDLAREYAQAATGALSALPPHPLRGLLERLAAASADRPF
ncbi:MAG: polyprenyl synthetase family protein, partial [Parvularcula sp.]|nr:polyprenyl synthetase family protein [Parvularcula sp.]